MSENSVVDATESPFWRLYLCLTEEEHLSDEDAQREIRKTTAIQQDEAQRLANNIGKLLLVPLSDPEGL